MKFIAIIALSVVGLGAPSAIAKDGPKPNPFIETLSSVPAAELPARAAQLVKESKARAREATTINVVKAALGINPAAAPALVGAIARAVPEMAPVAARTAAAEQPKQASAIAKAAAAAAPSQAGKIVAAVCRAVPKEYRSIAIAASEAVPDAGREILNAVASALPDLKLSIEKTLANYGGNVPFVGNALDQATKLSQNESRPPTIGPPYIPLSGTPANIDPSTSGEVPPGGRNYARP